MFPQLYFYVLGPLLFALSFWIRRSYESESPFAHFWALLISCTVLFFAVVVLVLFHILQLASAANKCD